jgi:hypothetical protein
MQKLLERETEREREREEKEGAAMSCLSVWCREKGRQKLRISLSFLIATQFKYTYILLKQIKIQEKI